MADPFSSKLTEEFAKATVKETISSLKGTLTSAQKYDLFGTALQTYVGRMEERYNTMRIFGMNKPIPLRDIYVRANILEDVTAQDLLTVKELEARFQRDTRRIGQVRETKEGLEVVQSLQKILVLGKPGAGKTTFLRYITLLALDGKLTENRLPIFVGLKDWTDSGKSLLDYIVTEFEICGLKEALPYIEHKLTKGQGLLLLDGLDEVTGDIDRAIKEIRDFTDKYSQNQFVLSCRIAANQYVFEQFTEVEIADFNDDQIRTFINRWFAEDDKTAGECWEQLNEAGNEPIKELAAIPLLLALLCITYHKRLDFPRSRSELYKEAIDALLKEWDSSRRIQREEACKKLSLKRKENLLSHLAYQTFTAGQYFIPQQDVERQIAAYIRHFPDMQDDMLDLDSEAILKAIESQHGLVVERARGIYSFSHLTCQEYFTARYIVENQRKLSLPTLVEQHLLDETWREVWLLTTEMLADAEDLVVAMHQQVSQRGVQPGVSRFLQKMDELIIKRDGRLPSDELRAWATALSLLVAFVCAFDRDLARDFAAGRDLGGAVARARARARAAAAANTAANTAADAAAAALGGPLIHAFALIHALAGARTLDLDLDRDRALDRALNLDLDRDRALDRTLDRDVAGDLALALLPSQNDDAVSFSDHSRDALADYLHSWEMLTFCLITECYVSTETRKQIMGSFLRPPPQQSKK